MDREHRPAPYEPLVKICGITRLEDALVALEAGADWLGFIRWPSSPRFRPVDPCAGLLAEIRRRAPRPFEAVGVYVDATPETIREEIDRLGLDRVQLHGEGAWPAGAHLGRPLLRVIKIRDAESIRAAEGLADAPEGALKGADLLTDTYDPALPGGTGRGYDYSLLRDLVRRRRVIVAGGLTPGNVTDVVRALRPWGVDVSSGVELAPGLKDAAKVRAFIRNAKRACEGRGTAAPGSD
jgi:phosphoribosylanthranilate isomerase